MTGGTQARRDRRRQSMRNEFAEVCLSLFEARGFDDVTVDEIAAAAEVSPRTFFRYFDAKHEVLFADHAERLDELGGLLAARPRSEPVLSVVRTAFVELAHRYEGEEGQLLLRRSRVVTASASLTGYALALQTSWEGAVIDEITKRIAPDPTSPLRVHVIATVCMGALRVAVGEWLASSGSDSYARLIDEAFAVLDGGLNPPLRASVDVRAGTG